MAIINSPPMSPVDTIETNGRNVSLIAVTLEWRNFFNAVYNVCNALTQSGITAKRPTGLLWIGRMFWDTTLGRPIWWNGAKWVFSDGTPA